MLELLLNLLKSWGIAVDTLVILFAWMSNLVFMPGLSAVAVETQHADPLIPKDRSLTLPNSDSRWLISISQVLNITCE